MENPPAAESVVKISGSGVDPAAGPELPEFVSALSTRYQHLLDRSAPYVRERWLGFACLALIYVIRVWFVQGFYIVTYGLGIFSLSQFVAFLSPMVDPEVQELIDGEGPSLPTRATDEFRPFFRRLPEFKFWYALTKAFILAFFMTFIGIFDIPVYWPILVFYFCVLSFVTVKRQIQHMIRYNYLPFNFGKQRYDKKAASTEEASFPE